MNYKFEIPSVNVEKILNKISPKYEIFNLQKKDKICTFYCKNKDKKAIIKILKNSGINIKNSNSVGILKYFKQISSVGILLGIIISCVLWFVSSFFITDVLIVGSMNFTSNEVMQVLKEKNINKWTLKSNINIDELQNRLQDIKYISYVSIILKGNALVINLKEQLTNDEVVSIDKYEPIISNYEGRVVSIKLIQGTANVKVGDIIKFGDVLVAPYVIKNDGTKLSVQPLADIVCDVWITSTLEVKNTKIEKVMTGNVISNRQISFLGINIFESKNDVNFINYETQTYTKYLANMLLPIKITYNNYYEYNLVTIENNFEQNKQQFIEQTRQMSLLNVKNYDIIKNESYEIQQLDDSNLIVYTITVNKKIC